jgi:hypothetical protein
MENTSEVFIMIRGRNKTSKSPELKMFSNCKQYGFPKCCSSLRLKRSIKYTQRNSNVVEIDETARKNNYKKQ